MVSTNTLKRRSFTSLDDISVPEIFEIFKLVPRMRKLVSEHKFAKTLEGQIIALLFFEPSSRTFGSFSSAIKRLGGQTIDYQDVSKVSSVIKGETLEDTVRVFQSYSDGIIMRHHETGEVKHASEVAQIPVINAGDGRGEHPTQTLTDIFTIWEKFGSLDNLTGLIAGDLLNGRTVNSLIKALSKYKNNTIYLLSPQSLKLNGEKLEEYRNRGINLIEIASTTQIPKNAHFWYWTRVQKERLSDPSEFEKLRNELILNKELADKYGSKDTIFMHPLPRVGEISEDLDSDPRAYYFKQVQNGLYVRMALLSLIFG